MAEIRAQLKRAFLQSIADAVSAHTAKRDFPSGSRTDAPVVTLLEGLKAFQRMGFSSIKQGKLSVGSAGFGHDVSWAMPSSWRSFSQESVFEMAQEFRELYNSAILTLTLAGTPQPFNDESILAIMMDSDELQSCTSTQKDFTGLRGF